MESQNKFIISDLHFWHKNIIKYCNRPYPCEASSLPFMNEDILKQFDNLPEGSVVINLGDLLVNSSKTFDELKQLVERMKFNNKKLLLVMGNHDRELSRFLRKQSFNSSYKMLLEAGFDRVYDKPFYMDGIIFSHEPVFLNNGTKNCHGHIHDLVLDKDYFKREIKPINSEVNPRDYYNACWDMQHRIVNYNEVLEYFFKN
jgi:calcineurin-like phosphoesterase family protein